MHATIVAQKNVSSGADRRVGGQMFCLPPMSLKKRSREFMPNFSRRAWIRPTRLLAASAAIDSRAAFAASSIVNRRRLFGVKSSQVVRFIQYKY
jgi:hypothetical protein